MLKFYTAKYESVFMYSSVKYKKVIKNSRANINIETVSKLTSLSVKK